MSNGAACCILGICCPPARQRDTIAKALIAEGLSNADAKKAAEWFAGELDSMGDLEEAVAKMKREHPPERG